jgi:hypothetical protein
MVMAKHEAQRFSRRGWKGAMIAAFLLTGCASPSPTGVPPRAESGPRPFGVNGASTTIEVARIALDPTQGSLVTASDLGRDCRSPQQRAFDPMTTLLAPLDSQRAVRGALQDYGYVTMSGGGEPLFDSPDARAGLQIGAVIAEIALETCGPRADGVHTQGTGRLRLVLDWQVFSPSRRQVVYATRTVGEARIVEDTPFLEATLYTAALREATRWLLSDPQFVNIAAPRARETPVYRGWRETYYYQPPIVVPDYGPYWRRYPIYRPDYLFYDPFFYRPYPPRVIVVPDRRYDRDRGRDYDRDRRRREGGNGRDREGGNERIREGGNPPAPGDVAPPPVAPPTPLPPILGPDGQPLPIDPNMPPPIPPDAVAPQPAPMPEAQVPAPQDGADQPRRRRPPSNQGDAIPGDAIPGDPTPVDPMPQPFVPAPPPAPTAPFAPSPPDATPAPMPEPQVPAPAPSFEPTPPPSEPRFEPVAPSPSFDPSPSFSPSPSFEPAPQPREEPRFERFEPPPQPREEPRPERFEPPPRNENPFGGASPGGDPFGGVELPNCSPDLPPGVPCR